MKISSLNTNFTGDLYINKPELFTDKMKAAIANNESINNKLIDHDIFCRITAKTEQRTTPYFARHRKRHNLRGSFDLDINSD